MPDDEKDQRDKQVKKVASSVKGAHYDEGINNYEYARNTDPKYAVNAYKSTVYESMRRQAAKASQRKRSSK